jgi:4-amino-4-deoxychorismate lyase
MCLLFETIKVENGVFQNLHYHEARMNGARKNLFNSADNIELEKFLSVPVGYENGIYKCRVDYDYYIHKIDFTSYKAVKIISLQLVYDDEITYHFKFADRSRLEELKKNANSDDVIIVKKGLITDSSFSNIIFFDDKKWVTPSMPLLKGTKRQELLDKKIIFEQLIKPSDLKNFKKAKFINAMLDFDKSLEIEMKNII